MKECHVVSVCLEVWSQKHITDMAQDTEKALKETTVQASALLLLSASLGPLVKLFAGRTLAPPFLILIKSWAALCSVSVLHAMDVGNIISADLSAAFNHAANPQFHHIPEVLY